MIPYFSMNVIQVGPISLQMWGFFASIGILFALFTFLKRAKKFGIEMEIVYDIFLVALIVMIIGSKLFYILFSSEPGISIGRFFSGGGFSFSGGMVSSAAAILFYLKLKKINVLKFADLLTPGLVISLIFIRIGCFLVYDHVGSATSLPWGIGYLDGSVRHPVSLYLMFGNIVIFFIIWYLEKRKTVLDGGVIFFIFLALYSIFRFSLDFTRCLDLSICEMRFFGFTYTQLLLLATFPVSVYLIYLLTINKKNG